MTSADIPSETEERRNKSNNRSITHIEEESFLYYISLLLTVSFSLPKTNLALAKKDNAF